MQEEEKLRIKNKISIISLALLVVVAGFFFIAANKKLISQPGQCAVLIAFLVFYWILTDVVEPKLLHELDHMPSQKRNSYLKFIGLDIVGYGALGYFVFNIGENSTAALVGGVIYIFCLNVKKKAKEEFYGYDERERFLKKKAEEEAE